jgi:hypothetical protein
MNQKMEPAFILTLPVPPLSNTVYTQTRDIGRQQNTYFSQKDMIFELL